jgi:DNA polymerase-1
MQLRKGKWIMHNGSFDLLALNTLTPYSNWTLAQDTMAMAYLLHPEERKGLQVLTGVYLGLPPYKDVDYKNILDEPIEKVIEMNGRDVARTYNLFRPLADELNQKPHLSRTYQWLLLPAITALVGITLNGVPVDRERLAALEETLAAELEVRLASLRAQVGDPDPKTYGKDDWPKGVFNPGSPQQVAHILFDQMGFPIIKYTKKDGKDTTNPSTDKEVLEKLSARGHYPFLIDLLEWRKANKMLTAFVNSWNSLMDTKNRLHPRYKPTQVVTGRLAAEAPNIQQVPRDPHFRRVFGGVPGFTWIKADLSQIELRLAAWLADEPTMLEAYELGLDLHAVTAQKVLGVEDVTVAWKPGKTARDAGKVLNFSLLYGAYPTKLIEIARSQYGVTLTKQEAERYRGIFFDTYPRLAEWHSEVKSELHATGLVASPLGRVRSFPEVTDPDEWVVKAAEREAINHPVQSFASDLVLHALTALPQDIRQYAIIELHDELDFLVPDRHVERIVPIVKATMEDVEWLTRWGISLDVPVLADVNANGLYWSTA